MENGLKSGYGTIIDIISNYTYEGTFQDGVKAGNGKIIWNDGAIYEGELENDII